VKHLKKPFASLRVTEIVIPAKAGIQGIERDWTPAFADVTVCMFFKQQDLSRSLP
jgi:hypothetical protein